MICELVHLATGDPVFLRRLCDKVQALADKGLGIEDIQVKLKLECNINVPGSFIKPYVMSVK